MFRLRKVNIFLAVIIGWLGGSILNGMLVNVGHWVFPLEGIDTNDMEALAEIMPTLEYEFYIFPFLAHALGTLAGSALAAFFAIKNQIVASMIVGVIFLGGGIAVNLMIPSQTWFVLVDIFIAYIPMAWLGYMIVQKFENSL